MMGDLTAPVSTERSSAGWRHVVRMIEGALGHGVAVLAAALVAADIGVLLSGVIARYVFDAPLVWSDEVAGLIFLWLSMLGSVVALRRGEHMRMTAFVSSARPSTRVFLDTLAQAAGLAFLVLILRPAIHYAAEEVIVATPALEISNAWRASALPIGVGLMIVTTLLRLLMRSDIATIVKAIALAAGLCIAMRLAGPYLIPFGKLNLILFFVIIVGACVFAGVPIAFSFGLATFGFLALTTRTPMLVLVGRMDEGMSHLILLAVPLFVFLGLLIEMTGMARAMVRFLASLVGHVRGGLSYVLIAAMYLVSGISGSKAADMAAIATATEVSTIGIAYSAVAGILFYRTFDARRLLPMLIETAALSGAIIFIIGAATSMAWALTQSGFASDLARLVAGLPGGRFSFIAVSIIVFVVLGSVLEGIPAIVLFGPLMFPIAHAVGVHEVHYAIIVVLAMGLGLFAPPFGVGYYAACAIGKVDPNEGIRPILGYMAALAIGLIIVAVWPWLSTGFL